MSRYQSEDRELLFGFYNRLLFKPILAITPRWINPNSVTIFAVLCSLAGAVTAYFAVNGHPAMYLVSAALVYAYLIADNIDGPLARVSGQTSTIGELLDHGCDAVTAGAMLIAGGMILHIEASWFFALSALGAMAFAVVMWEQFLTGLLIIPTVSGTEGVTLVGIVCMVGFFGDPSWLRLDTSTFNLSMVMLIILLCGYGWSVVDPLNRLRKANLRFRLLWVPLAVIASFASFVLLGANGFVPAVVINLYAARVCCRMIVHRHTGTNPPLWTVSDGLSWLPLMAATIFPDLWHINGWAALSAVIAAGLYLQTMLWGVGVLRPVAVQQQTA